MSSAQKDIKPILKTSESQHKGRRGSKSENYLTKNDPGNARRSSKNIKVTDREDPWSWDEMFNEKQVEPLSVYPTGKEEREYVCTTKDIRKWLIAGLVLQAICFLWAVILWTFIYFVWPLTFALDFEDPILMPILRNRFLLLVLAAEPLYNFILLIISLTLAKKMRWLLRLYYLVSPILLLLVAVLGFLSLFFVGNFTKADVESRLRHSLEYSYEGHNVPPHKHPHSTPHALAKKGWDDLQAYLHCCGVTEPSDWRFAFIDATPMEAYHVPESCCIVHRSGKKLKCRNAPDKTNTWQVGCLNPAYDLYMLAGYLTVTLSFVIIIVTVGCIIIAAEFYSSLRRGDGTDYTMSLKTYCGEACFGSICCRCKCGKSKNKVQQAPDEEVKSVASGSNVEDPGYQADMSSDMAESPPVTPAPDPKAVTSPKTTTQAPAK